MTPVAPQKNGLYSKHNYYLHANGKPITGLAISINITEDLYAPGGLGIQLQGWSQAGANCVWQQYIIMLQVSGSSGQLICQIDNWPSTAYSEALGISGNMINQIYPLLTLNNTGLALLPAGSGIDILLGEDGESNVNSFTFMAAAPGLAAGKVGPIQITNLPIAGAQPPVNATPAATAQLLAIQLDIVGHDTSHAARILSGGGRIIYGAASPLTVSADLPSFTSAQDVDTAEMSNAIYTELPAGPGKFFTQGFSHRQPRFLPGAPVAAIYRDDRTPSTAVFTLDATAKLTAIFESGNGDWTVQQAGSEGAAPPASSLAVTQRFGVPGVIDIAFAGSLWQPVAVAADPDGGWSGPDALDQAGVVPAGAGVAISQQFGCDNQTDLFFVDTQGRVVAYWAENAGAWQGPVVLSKPGFALPGAQLAAGQQFGANNQTNVYVVDNSGQLNVFWVENAGQWNGPVPIGPANFAPPGANIAVSQQFGCNNQTDVFLFNNQGQLSVFWVENAGGWQRPVLIGSPGLAPPGASLAAVQQFGCDNQTDVVFVGNNGALQAFWVENAGSWNGPVTIDHEGRIPPGAGVAACQHAGTANQTDVFFVDNAGQLTSAYVVAAGDWKTSVITF